MVNEEDSERILKFVMDELLYVFSTFKKDTSLGPNGWKIKFFLDFFDLLGEDLVRVVEEVIRPRKVLVNINTNFITLIARWSALKPLKDSFPFLCATISMMLIVRHKLFLSNFISVEQFGFLEGKKIHESISTSQ